MPLKPQDESEAQLTALLLGELPHDQAAALHQKLAEDAELAKLYERLKQTINLVRETLATPAAQTAGQPTPLKLSDQRRQKLLQHFKTIAPKEFVPPRRRGMPWLVPVGIAAAFVVILGGLLLPAFSKAKSRGQSLTFGTLSLSESAASARLAPPVQNSTRSYQGSIRRLDQSALGAQQPSGGAPIAPALQEAAPPAKPARTAIVLPQATELADSATTPAAGGVQPGFTVSGTTKGFYDDSLGRAGGMGGGGGFGGGGMGGSGGGVRSFSIATEGQQKELAAAVEQERMQDFSELAPPPILADSSSDTLEYKADGIVPTVGPDGEPLPPAPQSQPFVYRNAYIVPPEAAKGTGTGAGAGSTARQYQNSITAGDSFFSTDAETRRVADAGTQPPVAAPALRAILAPAQETPVQAVVSQPAPGPVPAAAEPALVANSVEVAAVPFQALGKDKAAGDLTTGLQAAVPGKPSPDVSNAGELLLKRNVAGLDSANKLADAAASAGGIAEANPSFSFYMDANRNPAPATPPAGSRPAQEVELKQALAGESPPPASGSYYGGGAFGGYSSIQKLPNGGDQGVVPARPALRSPKEGGFAGGVGNAALPTAPSSPQETAVNEAALRQANLNLSKQSDQKALGFDSYLGNSLARNGRLAAQDGTAPSEVDQVPVLGDVPLIGRLFQSTTGVSGGAVKADTTSATTTPASGKQAAAAYFSVDPETRRMVYIADEATANHIAQVLTNLDRPNSAGNTWEFGQQGAAVNSRLGTDANGASRLAQSPIVLPAAPSEAGLALKDGKDVQLFAAANQPAATPEHPQQREEKVREAQANVDRQRTEVEGKKEIDERLLASTLNSQQANLNQVLELYGKLVNRKVLRSPSVPSAAFDIKAAASLTRDEAIQVLDSALARHGITMVNVGNDVVKALPQTQGNTAGAPLNPVISGNSEPTPEETPKPAAPAPIPQPEVQTTDNAFSTFSLNVSDVSFKLAAASLEKGVMPEPATVRSEEFINAFDYRDPEPPPGVPVAFAWERAQYPFAQNRDLLRFSIKTAALGRQPGRPLNIVLLLDNSGSMERADRVRIIHEALRVLAGQLQPQDIFSVVTFSRTAHLWVDGVPGNQAAQVAEEVSGLTPQGGTNLEDAMNLAYQTALRHYLANGINRVVLLTDGAANLGNVDPEALKQKVEAHRKQGVALDCFGIGWEGYNDDLLEVLSRNGDGRYAFLNSPEEAATEFAAKLAGALQVAASDVKVQVEFNPARVTAYRQIGYAKHQLTKEQFRDNTVNAAQIGAAEAGNALYTVEVNPAGTGPLCTVRVRFRIPGTADYREHAWDVPFNGNAVALEQASPAMRLAATASAFSEWLASSPYAGEVTPDRLLGYLSGVPVVYGADARPTKLEWMIRQAKSIAGK